MKIHLLSHSQNFEQEKQKSKVIVISWVKVKKKGCVQPIEIYTYTHNVHMKNKHRYRELAYRG